MGRLLSYVFFQYIPFLLMVPILVLIGPFFFTGREAIRAVLLPLVGWKRAAWALPPARVTRIAQPDSFSRGSLGRMIEVEGGDGSLDPYELLLLGGLVRSLPAGGSVFEIGTFKGRTAINLAANLPDGGVLYSLDIGERLDGEMLGRHPAERQRAHFLVGDSTRFDADQFVRDHGPAQLVFIDGAHDLTHVVSDTRLALRMLADGGILAWHDYGTYPDVRRGVHEVLQEIGRLKDAVWFGGTSIAALRK